MRPRPARSFDFFDGAVGRVEGDQDAERAEGHQGVGAEVEEDGVGAEDGFGAIRSVAEGGGEADEEVSGVGDRGIGEEAFEVVLSEGDGVAQGHGEDGEDGGEQDGLVGDEGEVGDLGGDGFPGEDGGEDAEHGDEADGLGKPGEHGGEQVGRALVNVGGVEVERDGGDAEGEAGHDEDEGDGGEGGLGELEAGVVPVDEDRRGLSGC